MLDLSFLPIPSRRGDVQVFSTTGGNKWITWKKPRGVKMLYMLAIGPGGPGGAGFVGAVSAAGGGGGGGSGAQSLLLVPAFFLPDVLFISIDNPGAGNHTYVSIAPETNASSLVLRSVTGSTGSVGTATTGGAGGAGGGAAVIANNLLAGLGVYTFIAGTAGITGGFNAAGNNTVIPTSGIRTMAGAGGGGLPAAGTNRGGGISASAPFPSVDAITAAGAVGAAGFVLTSPVWMSYAGVGGATGSTTGGNGGAGGQAAYGSGGGGGGAALTGNTAGAGGKGGDGLVIIASW